MAGHRGKFPPGHGRGSYVAQPIVPFLRAAVREARYGQQSGLALVARRFAERFGMNERSVERHMSRVLSGRSETLRAEWADRLATFLELDAASLWPDKEVDPDES